MSSDHEFGEYEIGRLTLKILDLYNYPNEWLINDLYDLRVPPSLVNEFFNAGQLYLQAKFINLHQRGVDQIPRVCYDMTE